MIYTNNSENIGEAKDKNVLMPKYKELTIKGCKYKFKDTYKTGYCYRRINRTICKLIMFILFEEFLKIKDINNNTDEIKITINSKQQNHTCSSKTHLL